MPLKTHMFELIQLFSNKKKKHFDKKKKQFPLNETWLLLFFIKIILFCSVFH
jgi:hypothetical protein